MAERHNQGPIDFNEEPTSHFQVPKVATDPTVKNIGDIWLNTTSHAVKVQTNTSTTTTLGSGSGVSKYAAAIGDGVATTIAVTHSLGTLDIICQIWNISTGAQIVPTSITKTNSNAISIVFGSAPASSNARVVVIGS